MNTNFGETEFLEKCIIHPDHAKIVISACELRVNIQLYFHNLK